MCIVIFVLVIEYYKTLFTQVEVATGKFPYPKWNSVFDQLTQVVQGDPPFLRDTEGRFSPEFKNFVNTWYVSGVSRCRFKYT